MSGLAWGGLIQTISPISGADQIVRAEVICGAGGKWSGVVRKGEAYSGQKVVVILPDSILPPTEQFQFMERQGYRVKMMRLKGCPSEVLILPGDYEIGVDYTQQLGITKFEKPVPIGGDIAGAFPSFVPKTDEPNFQRVPEMIERLLGEEYYATIKYDGSSQTAYRWRDQFGVCSRNLEMKNGAGWNLVRANGIEERLPEGYAMQWECVGPGVQGNPLGLKIQDLRVFNIFDIVHQEYLGLDALYKMCLDMSLPMVEVIDRGIWEHKTDDEIRDMAKGRYYPSNKHREGIVIRAVKPIRVNGELLSFKVINLDYKDA